MKLFDLDYLNKIININHISYCYKLKIKPLTLFEIKVAVKILTREIIFHYEKSYKLSTVKVDLSLQIMSKINRNIYLSPNFSSLKAIKLTDTHNKLNIIIRLSPINYNGNKCLPDIL